MCKPMVKCQGCEDLIKEGEPFWKDARTVNGRWAFHFQDTHGITPDMLILMAEKRYQQKTHD